MPLQPPLPTQPQPVHQPETAEDDLLLLATRLRLGIPLVGFDGEPIPLRDVTGRAVEPIDAAYALMWSGAASLAPGAREAFIDAAIERARHVESETVIAGEPMEVVTARVTAVLVGAAVRASVLARIQTASPSELNRAVLSWHHRHDLQGRQLWETSQMERRLSA